MHSKRVHSWTDKRKSFEKVVPSVSLVACWSQKVKVSLTIITFLKNLTFDVFHDFLLLWLLKWSDENAIPVVLTELDKEHL